jgi:hypothetical protein
VLIFNYNTFDQYDGRYMKALIMFVVRTVKADQGRQKKRLPEFSMVKFQIAGSCCSRNLWISLFDDI